MATAPFNPDESIPADDDIVAQFPPAFRNIVDIFESWLLVEHDRYGHHLFGIDTTTNRDGDTWGNGALFYNTTVGAMQFRRGDAWDTISLASGTKALFEQTTAPVGWTKSTDVNNVGLRVVSGSASSGGTVDFTDVFKSQSVSGTVGNTTLTISQIPSHTHGGESVLMSIGSGSFIASVADNVSGNSWQTSSTGGGQPHTHSFTGNAIDLALKYIDVIRATKD